MINYVKGDATQPIGDGHKIIVHCCNNIGGWGSGFVVALSKRWGEPERAYRRWKQTPRWVNDKLPLGTTQFVKVEDDIHVCNIIGQDGVFRRGQLRPPVRYEAIRAGLKTVAVIAKAKDATVHMPRMGCGLAGGTWEQVGRIVEEELAGLEVFVYDLPEEKE